MLMVRVRLNDGSPSMTFESVIRTTSGNGLYSVHENNGKTTKWPVASLHTVVEDAGEYQVQP